MKIKNLFTLCQGNSLELMHVGEKKGTGINFVSRTAQNNGVAAEVERQENITPFSAGYISVALGGSVLSAFVQLKPFYTAFHIMVLKPKKELMLAEKLYYCMCIQANAYRYSYGRQANKTLKDIDLPDSVPEWVYAVPIKFVKTYITQLALPLRVETWKSFLLGELFNISVSKDENLFNSSNGSAPYVASSADNNGVAGFVDSQTSQKANTLTIARNGSVGSTFYQPKDYCSSPDDIRILTPKFRMNVYIGLFLKTIIEREKFKFGYGRKLGSARIKTLTIKLPVTSQGSPDWDYMERYIKSLPYSDRI